MTGAGDPGVVLTEGTGIVSVAPGTPADTYTITYSLCENLNPTNCDTADITVIVTAAPIEAIDDSASGINGYTGATSVLDVFANDTLNGVAVVPAEVTLTETIADPTGALTLNTDGSVDVASGTAAGTYQLTYQICEILNPTNCDTAVATVEVVAATIEAIDDSASGVNGVTGATSVLNVFTNDTLNGDPVVPSEVTLTETIADPAGALTLNANGSVDVAAGTTAGTYQLTYQICEVLNPANCDTAVATVEVIAAVINAVDDNYGPVNGFAGDPAVGDALINDTLNGSQTNVSEVAITILTPASDPGVVLDTGTGQVSVAVSTPAGTYTIDYQICEILNPSNCDQGNHNDRSR